MAHTAHDRPEPEASRSGGQAIPVSRPLLPSADRLLPYLRRIDTTRSYTNWGPLVSELEGRLCEHLGLPEDSAVSASSGTTALIGAVLATAGRARPERPLAVIPSYTFAATAIAVQACGYEPYLADIDADTWQLDADGVSGNPVLRQVGLVVPVAAFGRPVSQDVWARFGRRTGIPVVIDGAASFETLSADPGRFIGDVPVSLSFHATKTFATGEGGCVATTDRRLSRLVTESLNFGFYAGRESRSASTNGKMSEYHAAVGLAELESWPAKRLAFLDLADRYRRQLGPAGLADRCVAAPAIAGCYVLFRCAERGESGRVQESLARGDVGFRFWYGHGLHTQPYFEGVAREALRATERLAPLVIGLPVAIDLADGAIARVVAALAAGADTPGARSDWRSRS